MRKVVFKCDICLQDVEKKYINRFKRRVWRRFWSLDGDIVLWDRMWSSERYDICYECLLIIRERKSANE